MTLIDGLACSQALDKAGERLWVEHCDITDYQNKRATLVYEHKSGNKGTALDVVGRVVYGKKLFRPEDCETPRQRYWFDRFKVPCVYVVCRLRDGEQPPHPAADALVAEIRSAKRHGEPAIVGFSVEGKTIEEDSGQLKSTVARDLAITYKPANLTCEGAELLESPESSMAKSERTGRSYLPGAVTVQLDPDFDLELPADLAKTYEAGQSAGAPGSAVQGAALAEPVDPKLHDLTKRAEGGAAPAPPPKAPPAQSKSAKRAGSLTVRGQAVAPNPPSTPVRFDENTGTLHMPEGSLQAYLPSQDGSAEAFQQALNDPKASSFHDRAMAGWTRAHKRMREGRTPSEVAMHATLFSMNSPNREVPVQEYMYSKLVDAMRETGHDPRTPGFEPTIENWLGRNRPDVYPEHARRYFQEHRGVHTKQGVLKSYQLPGETANAILNYHRMHDGLMHIVSHYRHDARGAAGALLEHKDLEGKHEGVRKRNLAAGRPDPGPYMGGWIGVYGLAPKTTRYALSMMGGGNAVVPDTHFTRHLFGLDRGKDQATIAHLKTTLWNENNEHVLNGIDRWYARNHPAVEHMLQHPEWGKHFQSREDAIFPAFWRHWMAIVPHERARGMTTSGANEYTDHQPYWDAVDRFLKAEAEDDLPLRTAMAHRAADAQLGQTMAGMLFASRLLPLLLDHADARVAAHAPDAHPRLDGLVTELRQEISKRFPSEAASPALWPHGPEVHAVHLPVEGHQLLAGRVMRLGDRLHHLEDYHGVLARLIPEGPLDDAGHRRLQGLQALQQLSVAPDRPEPHGGDPGEAGGDPGEAGGDPVPGTTAAAVPPPQLPPPAPTEVYRYRRAGADHDGLLEVSGDQAYLDGAPVSKALLDLMLLNVERGSAKLTPAALKKSEGSDDLSKADVMEPSTALEHIRAAVKAGHLQPEVADAMTHHVYNDKMMSDIPLGNSLAYKEFLSRPRPGVHVALDLNGMKQINDRFGHAAGDDAIRGYFHAIRGAVDEAVGRDEAKTFRNPAEYNAWRHGGDEGQVHVPSYEHALRFAHALRQRLDALPPVGGTHKLSTSIGLGATPDDADRALYRSKTQKTTAEGQSRFPEGQVPHLMHSLVPGREGPIQLHREAPPLVAPPIPTNT